LTDELVIHADLGDKARAFLDSEIGRFLSGAAEQEMKLAALELSKLNLFDPDQRIKAAEYQKTIQCANWFEDWIVKLIQDGEEALNVIIARRDSGS
jgi:hypothetical protein